jgi:hypothetical protein
MLSRRSFALGLLSLGVTRRLLADAAPALSVEATKTHVDFKRGKELLTRYVIDEKVAKPYFWPLNVAESPVTRGWPMDEGKGEAKDHPHQKSAWFCHGDVIPQGVKFAKHIRGVEGLDFWSEAKGHGKIVCTSAKVKGTTLETANEWRTAEGDPILAEARTVALSAFGPVNYLLAIAIDLDAKYCGVVFADTKEGSMGVRVRESIRVDKGKGRLVNAAGKVGEGKGANADKKGCWGLVSDWCDYSGPVDDKGTVAGIAVFADPKNKFDSAWHARNYGLLAANPFGREKHAKFPDRKGNNELVRLEKGEHLKLRFGLYLHAGDEKAGKVGEAFAAFAGKK